MTAYRLLKLFWDGYEWKYRTPFPRGKKAKQAVSWMARMLGGKMRQQSLPAEEVKEFVLWLWNLQVNFVGEEQRIGNLVGALDRWLGDFRRWRKLHRAEVEALGVGRAAAACWSRMQH